MRAATHARALRLPTPTQLHLLGVLGGAHSTHQLKEALDACKRESLQNTRQQAGAVARLQAEVRWLHERVESLQAALQEARGGGREGQGAGPSLLREKVGGGGAVRIGEESDENGEWPDVAGGSVARAADGGGGEGGGTSQLPALRLKPRVMVAPMIEQPGALGGRLRRSDDGDAAQLPLPSPRPPAVFPLAADAATAVAAVVVMACSRAEYLDKALRSLTGVHARDARFPLFVSQDGSDEAVRRVALSWRGAGVQLLQHEQTRAPKLERPGKENPAYYRIADHYAWALGRLFGDMGYRRVIILEDDMEVAPDFFDYFAATAPLLDADPTLWCVSSWNDNGKGEFVHDARELYRSDFFPGLGWMLTRELWHELAPKWPRGYWDDWMRLSATRQGRQCIRPEVCRTYNFGAKGTSRGQYFRQYLQDIRLNQEQVDWASADLSHLAAAPYERRFRAAVAGARVVRSVHEALGSSRRGDFAVVYGTRREFELQAGALGIMKDVKDGVPRASYRGVVTVRLHGGRSRIFLVPRNFAHPSPPAEQG